MTDREALANREIDLLVGQVDTEIDLDGQSHGLINLSTEFIEDDDKELENILVTTVIGWDHLTENVRDVVRSRLSVPVVLESGQLDQRCVELRLARVNEDLEFLVHVAHELTVVDERASQGEVVAA